MSSAAATPEDVRKHAQLLLKTIGVSRIVVVDDEYAPDVEEVLGICAGLDATKAADLPYLRGINFEADRDIWSDAVRERWTSLDDEGRRGLLERARAFGDEAASTIVDDSDDTEDVDSRAATSLGEILGSLDECDFVPLALGQWRATAAKLLADGKSAQTVFLFDRDFRREEEGTDDQGLELVREVQDRNVGYTGLITHTVAPGAECDEWSRLSEEYNLNRDRFVVIAKKRLTSDTPDYYGFLGMLRLAALSDRYAQVKSAAWNVFEKSVAKVEGALENLSVLDFDRIIFGSSRREGVWEPDTLFRVFTILMRREARALSYQNEGMSGAFRDARRVSAMPEEIDAALRKEKVSREALRIQRFESYESDNELNPFHVPIELGDIFEAVSNRKRYILLVQPCDLMVRGSGKRAYEDGKHGRTGALVELVTDPPAREAKESWGELQFYNEGTGRSAFADFARVHQIQLAVIDLCALRPDGKATFVVDEPCPKLLIVPWQERYNRLQRFFKSALTLYHDPQTEQLSCKLRSLALPAPSTTLRVPATIDATTVQYSLKRVMRLRQPWSGALLTAFTHYQARAAFEHPFEHHVPT